MKLHFGIALVGTLAVLTSPVAAQVAAAANDRDEIEAALASALRAELTREAYLSGLTESLNRLDRDSDGVDMADIQRVQINRKTQARANAIRTAMSHDHDGDGIITPAEIEKYDDAAKERRDRIVNDLFERYDSNDDGRIVIAEMIEERGEPYRSRRRNPEDLFALLLTQTGGNLTRDTMIALGGPVFAKYDSDGNGVLSGEEAEPAVQFAKAFEEARKMRDAGCIFPAVPKNARMIWLTAYQGPAISTAAVGGSMNETTVIDVAIEEGRQPIYLLLGSFSANIWRFTGDTGRIVRIVASSAAKIGNEPQSGDMPERASRRDNAAMSAVGIVGVPRDAIMITNTDCLSYAVASGQNPIGQKRMELVFGKQPDAAIDARSATRVSLPSGILEKADRTQMQPAPDGFPDQAWREAVRFYPGGLSRIDPAAVIAAGDVSPYAVLPNQMGVAQLIGEGRVERDDRNRFKILGPIAHFPAGMSGAHSVTWILPDSVATPGGDRGHSCILTETEATQQDWRKVCSAQRRPIAAARTPTPISTRD